jgi:hypothetical protein
VTGDCHAGDPWEPEGETPSGYPTLALDLGGALPGVVGERPVICVILTVFGIAATVALISPLRTTVTP